MAYHRLVTGPLYAAQHSLRRSVADKTTRDYIVRMNGQSCLDETHAALAPLLDGNNSILDDIFGRFAVDVDTSHRSVWTLDSFTRYLDTRLSCAFESLIPSFAPLLWSIFTAAAEFPLASSLLPLPADRTVDGAGFRCANAFLVLRGFELLGNRKDGTSYAWDRVEKGYAPKLSRLARIVFCLLRPTRHVDPNTQPADDSTIERLLEQNICVAISFAQPIVYLGYPSPTGNDRGLDPACFDTASHKVLVADQQRCELSGQVWAGTVQVSDLRALVELLVVHLCVDQQRWRDGLVMPYKNLSQRSGDVQYARLESTPSEDATLVSSLVESLVSKWFGGEHGDYLDWPSFQKWFIDNPAFIFFFFELWAAIFAPLSLSLSGGGTTSDALLSPPLANLLSLLGVATFFSGSEAKYRFHMNEHHLLQALRTSSRMLSISHSFSSSGTELFQTLTAGAWFHMLVVRGEDLDASILNNQSSSRLLVLFLQPTGAGVEMWLPDEDDMPVVKFAWRQPVIQLLPQVVIPPGSGLVCAHYNDQTKMLSFESSGVASGRHSRSESKSMTLNLDLDRKILSCSDFGHSPLRLQMLRVDCYRLVEEASYITRSKP